MLPKIGLIVALAQACSGASAEPGAVQGDPGFAVVHARTAHDALFDLQVRGARVFAVGDHGLVLTSQDGGRTWQTRSAPADQALLGLDMTADGQGVIVGQEGIILRTEDHGVRWSLVTTWPAERLFSVGLDSSGFALAAGAFGTLLASADHGASWRSAAPDWDLLLGSPEAPHLYDVLLVDARTALVVGEFGLLLRTDDAAARWSVLRQGERSLFALRAAADGGLWAMGQDGLLLRSSDRGRSWQRVDLGRGVELLDLALRADGRGLLIGLNDLFVTDDGGASWTSQPVRRLPLPWHQPVALTPAGDFLVAGAHGSIVRIDGNGPVLRRRCRARVGRPCSWLAPRLATRPRTIRRQARCLALACAASASAQTLKQCA
jgi:photosystem II stability/assembly factor-like uncharacterized protein